MGQKQSKDPKKVHSPPITGVRPLYPDLAKEFSTYGHANMPAFRNTPTYEAGYGNTTPNFQNVQSYYYNPVPSAPPEMLSVVSAETTAIAYSQSSIKQEGEKQRRDPIPEPSQVNRGIRSDKNPCPNAGDGCKLHFTPEQMKWHVKECLFMDVVCPLNGVFGNCAWRDKVKHIMTHFKDVHPSNIGQVNQQVSLGSPRIVNLIDLNPYKFLVHIKVDQNGEQILIAVQHYSTQICASKWTYEFIFEGPMMANTVLEGACISAGISVEKKFNKLQCRVLTMSPCVMNAFKNGALKYKYRIMKKDKLMVPKKIEETGKTMTAPLELPGNKVGTKQALKVKRSKKSTKTPLPCT